MATQLVDALAGDWKPSQYHDTYTEELRQRIKAKDAGKDIVEEEPQPSDDAKVVDLMAALSESVEKARSGRRKPAKKAAKKSA
jgi:DNA end-binding protein Ku